MKQFIVLIGMIALGIFIFSIIAGLGENTLIDISGRAILDAMNGIAGT